MEAVENVRIADESEDAEAEHTVTDKDSETQSVDLAEVISSTFGFTEKTWRTDFCLVVEGTKLYVAKVILSLASPVFDAMFQSDFKEKSSDELELPGKKLKDVLEFLRCIYPNTCAQINRDNARAILPILEEYQVFQHKSRCEVVLLETVTEKTSTDELLQLLKEACLYDLKALRARCIFLISSRPCDVLDESYCKLFPSASALNEIFVNINTSMKRKLAELEEDTKGIELFKEFITSEIRAKKDFKCDPKKHWEQKTVVLTDLGLDDHCENEGIEVNMWGVPLKVKTSESRCSGSYSYGSMALYVDVKNVGPNKITCDVNLHSILVNRQPNGNNLVKFKEGVIKKGSQTVSFEIESICSIKDVDNGFLVNKKFGIIAQLFMSKPNLESKQ